MSNQDRAARREYLAKAIRHLDEARAALMAQRERDPHSVDQHAINDVGRPGKALLAEFLNIGGSLADLYPDKAKRRK
jgi:hypothetical protein